MQWKEIEILILVKAYPNPSQKYGETVCTAGITRDGRWIRLYPVTFRELPPEKQYKKFAWIRAKIKKSNEKLQRPESHKVDVDSIVILGFLPPGQKHIWERQKYFLPMVTKNLEILEVRRDKKELSLGVIKPAEVIDFIIEKDKPEWSMKQLSSLSQEKLYGKKKAILEKIPYKFKYHFRCDNTECKGHTISIVDWEVYEAYRAFKKVYKTEEKTLQKLKEKFLNYYFYKKNSYIILGTESGFNKFMILGVYSPPSQYQTGLDF